MPDPFADVDSAPPEVIEMVAAGLETRAADPAMLPVIDAYLDAMQVPDGGLIVDIGSGTGGVTRRIAERFAKARVLGAEPSAALTAKARELGAALANLTLEQADGAALPLADGAADVAILHTVLSHVADPAPLLAEAARVLRPGGTLVICDADFSKARMGSVPGDPLDSCAQAFVAGAVTDPWVVGRLRGLVAAAGLTTTGFTVINRVVTEGMGSLVWVRMSGAQLVAQGVIGKPLLDALEAEYLRRAEAGSLYGFLPFATLTATKPGG